MYEKENKTNYNHTHLETVTKPPQTYIHCIYTHDFTQKHTHA